MTDERWADIPGFHGRYEVSDYGRVFNTRRKRFLRGGTTKDGYRQVTLTLPGRQRFFLVHTLVLTAFQGPCPEGFVCTHLNKIRGDNNLSNLQWMTPTENVRHTGRRFNPALGEAHPRSKFTTKDVLSIRARHKSGTSIADLAWKHRVTRSAIWKIVRRKTWRHVPAEAAISQ
jgi:hypothetical protein